MPELQCQPERFGGCTHHSPSNCQREIAQLRALEASAIACLVPDLRKDLLQLASPVFLFDSCDLSRFTQRLAPCGIHMPFQPRQDPVPDPIASVPQIAVARILTPGLPDFS